MKEKFGTVKPDEVICNLSVVIIIIENGDMYWGLQDLSL